MQPGRSSFFFEWPVYSKPGEAPAVAPQPELSAVMSTRSALTESSVRSDIWQSEGVENDGLLGKESSRTSATPSSHVSFGLRPCPLSPSASERISCRSLGVSASSSPEDPRKSPPVHRHCENCIFLSFGVRRSPAGCATSFAEVRPYIFFVSWILSRRVLAELTTMPGIRQKSVHEASWLISFSLSF